MGAAKILLSAEEFDNYPFEEDKRYELDEGELIEMTRPGLALMSENLYALSPATRRTPDVAVILGNRREDLRTAKVIHITPISP